MTTADPSTPASTEPGEPRAGRIYIGGTGRAGTSLLVELLDELGFETARGRSPYHEEARAGHETSLLDPAAPQVVKNPRQSGRLLGWLRDGTVDPAQLACVIIPVRDLDQATWSRLARSNEDRAVRAAGGVTGTRRPWRERDVLAADLASLLLAVAEFQLPHALLAFPRFAADARYCWQSLAPVLGDLPFDAFEPAWSATADPGRVTAYDASQASLRKAVPLVLSDTAARLRRRVR